VDRGWGWEVVAGVRFHFFSLYHTDLWDLMVRVTTMYRSNEQNVLKDVCGTLSFQSWGWELIVACSPMYHSELRKTSMMLLHCDDTSIIFDIWCSCVAAHTTFNYFLRLLTTLPLFSIYMSLGRAWINPCLLMSKLIPSLYNFYPPFMSWNTNDAHKPQEVH
jgi:hypothetical protein